MLVHRKIKKKVFFSPIFEKMGCLLMQREKNSKFVSVEGQNQNYGDTTRLQINSCPHKARNGKIWIQTENRYKVIDGMVKTGFSNVFSQGCVDSKILLSMSQFNVSLSIFLDSVAHSVQFWYMTFSCKSNMFCLNFWIRVRQIP